MKFPLTIRFEYSSRKKNGGLRELDAAGASGAASKDMAEESAGECGIGGTLGGWADDGEYEGVVGEGVPWPLPLPCWLLLLERPPNPWRLIWRS